MAPLDGVVLLLIAVIVADFVAPVCCVAVSLLLCAAIICQCLRDGVVLLRCYFFVKREVKILKALTGHENVVQFYDAFEDDNYVYIVME